MGKMGKLGKMRLRDITNEPIAIGTIPAGSALTEPTKENADIIKTIERLLQFAGPILADPTKDNTDITKDIKQFLSQKK